jgi:hypothetical protein
MCARASLNILRFAIEAAVEALTENPLRFPGDIWFGIPSLTMILTPRAPGALALSLVKGRGI